MVILVGLTCVEESTVLRHSWFRAVDSATDVVAPSSGYHGLAVGCTTWFQGVGVTFTSLSVGPNRMVEPTGETMPGVLGGAGDCVGAAANSSAFCSQHCRLVEPSFILGCKSERGALISIIRPATEPWGSSSFVLAKPVFQERKFFAKGDSDQYSERLQRSYPSGWSRQLCLISFDKGGYP